MTKQILFILLSISCLLSCDETETPTFTKGAQIFAFTQLEEDSIHQGNRFTYPNSTLQFTGWGVYEDIIFEGTNIEWSLEKVNSTAVTEDKWLKCAITGGDPYNNVFFTNTCALRWEGEDWEFEAAQYLEYELDFFIEGTIDCSNPDIATIEGIEFTWQHILLPHSHGLGVQWSKGGAWRFWNDEQDDSGHVIGWQDFEPKISSCLTANEWHHIKLTGYFQDDILQYEHMELNGTVYDLSSAKLMAVNAQSGWVENFLQIGMQINGNTATDTNHGHGVDPVVVYLNNVSFKGYSWQ